MLADMLAQPLVDAMLRRRLLLMLLLWVGLVGLYRGTRMVDSVGTAPSDLVEMCPGRGRAGRGLAGDGTAERSSWCRNGEEAGIAVAEACTSAGVSSTLPDFRAGPDA